jgi:hypothetical protein
MRGRVSIIGICMRYTVLATLQHGVMLYVHFLFPVSNALCMVWCLGLLGM